jgi:CheY-like chemotaxis protein
MKLKMSLLDRKMHVLMADDDDDDRLLATEALEESGINAQLHFVNDGVELFEYLDHVGRFAHAVEESPRPDLILLDLNMPRRDGREALQLLKNNAEFRRIPVVVFTTSRSQDDISSAYDSGANSYLTKPMSFDGLVDTMQNIGKYWAETVHLPSGHRS